LALERLNCPKTKLGGTVGVVTVFSMGDRAIQEQTPSHQPRLWESIQYLGRTGPEKPGKNTVLELRLLAPSAPSATSRLAKSSLVSGKYGLRSGYQWLHIDLST